MTKEQLFEKIYKEANKNKHLTEMFSGYGEGDPGFESAKSKSERFASRQEAINYTKYLYRKALATGLYELTRRGNLIRKDRKPITWEERKSW